MTCGKPIGHLWEKYTKQIENDDDSKKVLDSLGVERYCCRAVFLTHEDMTQKVGRFKKSFI